MVFLDEPTTGLDPQSRAHMWDEIRRLRDEGMTVFITTHYLDEADALCDRIAIMDHGEIVAEGTPTELKREISGDVVMVGLDAAATAAGRAAARRRAVRQQAGDRRRRRAAALRRRGRHRDPADPARARRRRHRAQSIELHRPSLDDVFLTKTGRSLRES